MAGRSLRSGFTTGACAAAAVRGAALLLCEQRRIECVEIDLPAGFAARFELNGQAFDQVAARCFVIKDAGDDPDVTHGVEVHAEVRLVPRGADKTAVIIEGGIGIGRVTKPGLAVPVGEWAINPVPRQMITEAVESVFPPRGALIPKVTISIPDGEERAKRTLNARLGILGGLSILGTTGVVRPVSHRAWTDTIEVAIDVALAGRVAAVVLSTGRTSEARAQGVLSLPEEAFVMMGDHVGYALESCHRRGLGRVVVAAQFAKLLKIACGHAQTHVSASRLDLSQLAGWARQSGLDGAFADRLECANTARAVWQELGVDHPLIAEVVARALSRLRQWAPGARLALLLVGYDERPPRVFGDLPRGTREEGKL
jgi:cobalt-precorrin-5B (C1)-methyltransferase